MSKPKVEMSHVGVADAFFQSHPHLHHLRARRHGDLLTIESGPLDDAFAHARLRRETVHLWRLEMPHGRRWEKTPFRDRQLVLLELLVETFPWTLVSLEL